MPQVPCPIADNTPEPGFSQGVVTIRIPGRPFAKQRPRFSRKSGRAFTPSETVSFERTVGTIAAPFFPQPMQGAVRVEIYAHFAMPASWSHKKREAHMHRPHLQRPDLDNVQKAICDGLNRIAFGDDGQIAEFHCLKIWDLEDYTVVRIGECNVSI